MHVPTRRDVVDSHDQLRGALLFALRTIRKMRSRDEVGVEVALLNLSKVLADARTLRKAIRPGQTTQTVQTREAELRLPALSEYRATCATLIRH